MKPYLEKMLDDHKKCIQDNIDTHQSEGFSVPIAGWRSEFDINSQDDQGCKHDWKNYIGFREAYRYCTKCSEKRSLDEQ